jgi:hypothetical protein
MYICYMLRSSWIIIRQFSWNVLLVLNCISNVDPYFVLILVFRYIWILVLKCKTFITQKLKVEIKLKNFYLSAKYKSMMMYGRAEGFSGNLRCFYLLCAHIALRISACKWCMFYFAFVLPWVKVVKVLCMLYCVLYIVSRVLANR